ncbi:MAG TPA: TonB-dependent receptor, partial [Myxococcaceae bacterium]|nr:TonB-dependent receptor [Myxococcaceae bacterium]
MVSRSPSGVAALLLLLWGTSSIAGGAPEQPPSEDAPEAPLPAYELPEVRVEVTGERPSPEQIRAREPTGAISVVEVEDRAGRAPDTAALLTTIPGVHLQQLGGFGQAQSLSLRGASSSGVLVMLDGIPLNGAGGLTDLSRLPTAWLSRIEVLRGGGGAAYGSGALGGAVNLVTRGLSDTPSAEVELGAGSFGAFHGLANFAGPVLGGEALLLLHGSTSRGDFPYLHDDTPGHEDPLVERRRMNNDAHLAGGLLRFRRSLGHDLEVSALAELGFDERGVAGPALNVTPNRRDAHRRLTAAARLDHAPAEGPTLSARAWVRSDDAMITGFGASSGAQSYQTGAVELSAAHALHPAHRVMLELGFGGERYHADFSPSAPNRLRAHLSLKDTWIPLDGLLVVPALRLEQVGEQTLLAPKVGAELRLSRHWFLRANVGQSHRAPSFLELYVVQPGLAPNPALLPERAVSGDLGVAWETRVIEASVTAYYGLYENLITYEFF